MRLQGIFRRCRRTPPKVFGYRDRLKMGWVYAAGISAKVIDGKAAWDWPNECLVRNPMGLAHLRPYADIAVTPTVLVFLPIPTIVGGDDD
jgi:hypothetical protein